MSSVIKTLFGGGTATSQSTSTPTNLTSQDYQNLTPDVASFLKNLLGSYGQTGPSYPYGSTTASISPTAQSLLDKLGTYTQSGGVPQNVQDYLSSVISGKYLPGQPGANPFLDATITAAQRPTLDNLTQVLSKTLPGRFTANGQFIQPNTNSSGGSSAFDNAAAYATGSAAKALGDIASNISGNAYTTERGNQQQAAQLSSSDVTNMINTLQAETLPTLIQQNGINNGLALFQQQTQALLQLLQTLGGVTQPTVANTQQSTSSQDVQKGIIPGLTQAFSAAFPKGA